MKQVKVLTNYTTTWGTAVVKLFHHTRASLSLDEMQLSMENFSSHRRLQSCKALRTAASLVLLLWLQQIVKVCFHIRSTLLLLVVVVEKLQLK
jgi:hypothetical protein